MRIVATAFGSVLLISVAFGQVWDKTVVPGLTYHMEYDAALPRMVHALRYSPGSSSVKAIPELANGTVYSDDDTKGRETVSEMVARTGAIAGLNGDYFPFTGDPLGLMIREGQLLSQPVKPRAAFGWSADSTGAGIINWRMTLTADGMDPIDLDGINQQCGQNCCVVNEPAAGIAVSQKPSTCVVLKIERPVLGATGDYTCEVSNVFADVTSVPLASDALVVMGHGTKAGYLNALRQGQKVTISVETQGLDFSKLKNVIGGGPMLVQNSHSFVSWQDEGFTADFATKRHPRSAVGRTKEGDIWFVAVDGRQTGSVGATLDEMSAIMLKLGCTDAINLDGGGSTALNLFGLALNRPTDGKEVGERKVANGVMFYGEPPAPSADNLTMTGPAKFLVNGQADMVVRKEDGATIPNAEVIWYASGSAYIDQGGRLYPFKPGPVAISAFVRGQRLSLTLNVEAPAPVVSEPAPAKVPPAETRKLALSSRP